MTNDITTTASQDVAMTLDQWLVERDKVVGQVKRLVHLWFVNKLGSQREIAKHLQISPGTVSGHVKSLRLSGDLTDDQYAQVPARSNARIPCKPVENSTLIHPIETSDESPFIECNSYSNDTILDVTPLQQRSGPVSFSEEVRSTQPEMDTDCPQQDAELVSMDTEAIRQRNADFEEISRLVRCIEDIHARNLTTDGSGLHEQQWRGLSQQYKSLKYTADLRWQRLRAEMDREHEAFERQLDSACRAFGSKGDS